MTNRLKLESFEMGDEKHFHEKGYDTMDAEKVSIIKKQCRGLFQTLDEKFKLLHNETVLSLQYCKLLRDID